MRIHVRDDMPILDLGKAEIWDGADLVTVRETLTQLGQYEQCRAIGVNMRFVKVIPSGFFGTILDWHESGVAISLYSPQLNVQNMLWFQKFCEVISDDCYMLLRELLGNGRPTRISSTRRSITTVAQNPPLAGLVHIQCSARLPELDYLA